MKRYEYRTIQYKVKGNLSPKIEEDVITALLNENAQEGWELYNTVPICENYGRTVCLQFILRREMKQKAEA
ncbi:MAG: DUF4177 domain-containing protein [Clostridiales Family XIII bacterium]|jgi:hypothetical protein|nr:DUF4177 domain-containing protein [Clostridiales Family XIII bacterium]